MIRPLFVSSAGYLVAGVSLLIAVDGYLEVEGIIEETARYLADEGTGGGAYTGYTRASDGSEMIILYQKDRIRKEDDEILEFIKSFLKWQQ